jgi:hypothetical protein
MVAYLVVVVVGDGRGGDSGCFVVRKYIGCCGVGRSAIVHMIK